MLRSTASIDGHPIHPMLVPFPIAFLVGTLAPDLAFWGTGRSVLGQGLDVVGRCRPSNVALAGLNTKV
jgi:uncharacterized membrane protein